jgi:uncharacterized membrane protein
MYTLLGALAVLSYLQLLHILDHPRAWMSWLVYGMVLLAAVYIHYFGAFLLLAHALPFLLHRRQRPGLALRWLIAAGVVCLAFLPWLIVVVRAGGFQEAPIDWIDEARWYEPLLTFYALTLGSTAQPAQWWNWAACAALLVAFVWGIRRVLRYAHPSFMSEPMLCHMAGTCRI